MCLIFEANAVTKLIIPKVKVLIIKTKEVLIIKNI